MKSLISTLSIQKSIVLIQFVYSKIENFELTDNQKLSRLSRSVCYASLKLYRFLIVTSRKKTALNISCTF